MKFVWPVPGVCRNEAPSILPDGMIGIWASDMTLTQFNVYAMVDGQIRGDPADLRLLNTDLAVLYRGMIRTNPSDSVKQGDLLGIAGHRNPFSISLRQVQSVTKSHQQVLRGPISPENLQKWGRALRGAWAKVTHRFHRDFVRNPNQSTKERIRWLMAHPMWTYPSTISDIPDSILGFDFDGVWPRKPIQMGSIYDCMDGEYVFVDPTTESIQEDESRNTDFRVWLESGHWFDQSEGGAGPPPPEGWNEYNRWVSCHNPDLDCGGPSMQDALLWLADRVEFFYGEGDRPRVDTPRRCTGSFTPEDVYIPGCEDAGDGFCSTCGFLCEG